MATIDDLRTLGYAVGIAQGDVSVEEAALAAAKADAAPEAILGRVNTVTRETLADIRSLGRLPDSDADRQALSAMIAQAALAQLTEKADTQVAFHERALEIAQEMPDVWHVSQAVETGDGDRVVVLALYVSCKPDGTGWDTAARETLDALADPDGYAEREYLAFHPAAAAAAAALASRGVSLTRPAAGADTWIADGGDELDSAGLEALLAEVEARPAPPTVAERVAAAITDAPEISDATKRSLAAALKDG